MHMIINRCVDFSKAASGMPLVPTIAAVQVHAAVESIVESCRAQTDNGAPAIKLSWDHSVPEDLVMQTDGLWFEESLHVLIDNAIKFSPLKVLSPMSGTEKGQDSSQVDVEVSLTGGESEPDAPKKLCLIVKDHGLGIAEDRRDTLFTYSRILDTALNTSVAEHSGGAGLGLYSLACRCLALKGSITYTPNVLDNGEECGSIFTLQIPIKHIGTSSATMTPISSGASSRTHRSVSDSVSVAPLPTFVRDISSTSTPKKSPCLPHNLHHSTTCYY